MKSKEPIKLGLTIAALVCGILAAIPAIPASYRSQLAGVGVTLLAISALI